MQPRLQDGPEEAALREEFRGWLRRLLPAPWVEAAERRDEAALIASREAFRPEQFWREMGEAGYAAPGWPREWGGLGVGPWAERVLVEELRALRLPVVSPNILGLSMAGPTLMIHGTEEQRRRFLPGILTSEEIWCQLFSEPAAGSDLAAVATRAVARGRDFVVSGQKVWTSFAQRADWGMLLARTDPDVPKHAGLTWFVLDMDTSGVEVRPLRQMTGDAEFNEVFLDGGLVPGDQVVGGVGRGWEVAKTTLMHERVALSGAAFGGGSPHLDLLQSARRAGPLPPGLRDEVLRRYTEGEVRLATAARVFGRRRAGEEPGPEGSIGKLYNAEFNQRLTATALRLRGTAGLLADQELSREDRVVRDFLRARANTIEGGTSEILRNLIGERVLGLPGEPRVDLDRPWRELPADPQGRRR